MLIQVPNDRKTSLQDDDMKGETIDTKMKNTKSKNSVKDEMHCENRLQKFSRNTNLYLQALDNERDTYEQVKEAENVIMLCRKSPQNLRRQTHTNLDLDAAMQNGDLSATTIN